MLLTNAVFALAQSILGDFCAKAKSGETRAKQEILGNGSVLVSRDVLQCLDGFLDRLRLGSLGGLSKQPSSQFESKSDQIAVRFAIYIAFASAVET